MVCSNCMKRSGAAKCSRCKITAYCNRECQRAHWSAHKKHCKPHELSPQKLDLRFYINHDPPVLMQEDIPLILCSRDAPRELTSRWISNLVNTHEEGVLEKRAGPCTYCPEPGVALHTTLSVTLHQSPPTVLVVGQRLCQRNRFSPCAIMAEKTMQDGMKAPGFPGEPSDVYTV
ncbi:zinc finger MYND domain-containing protein 10 [Favolaschia claudopus]|uniref:Zinc finger MYND domain-containing protein 10 n=1 Tax=Favolaschia claudopus TaxID=2862362 RepID=A0AAW0C8R6_9AGAR